MKLKLGNSVIARVIAGAFAGQRVGLGVRQAGHHHDLVSEGSQGLQDRRHLERRGVALGRPSPHEDAVRHVDDPEPVTRRGGSNPAVAEGGNHPVQERQRQRCTDPAQKGPSRQMLVRDDHVSDALRI